MVPGRIVQYEAEMHLDLGLLMPRMTPEAFLHVAFNMGVEFLLGGPSLSLGAVISNRIRAQLRHISVDAWRLAEDCEVLPKLQESWSVVVDV